MGAKNLFRSIITICCLAALLFCVGCGDQPSADSSGKTKANSKAQIKIATKNTPEQNILAHLAQNLITEKTNYTAEVVYYDDSTSASLLEKMENGDIQIFFDYTGSLAVNALEYTAETINTPTLTQDVQNSLKHRGITASEEIGYSSTTSFYITIERRAELKSPSTLSEIANLSPDLTIGMDEGFFKRLDCYKAICEAYNMKFKEATVYEDEESGFRALIDGEIDLYIAPSVSPYLSQLDVKQLVDNEYFFLPQVTCCLISDEAIKKYPEIEPTLKNLEGLINASRMSLMIKRIYWEGNDIDEYIHTYLRANNLI